MLGILIRLHQVLFGEYFLFYSELPTHPGDAMFQLRHLGQGKQTSGAGFSWQTVIVRQDCIADGTLAHAKKSSKHFVTSENSRTFAVRKSAAFGIIQMKFGFCSRLHDLCNRFCIDITKTKSI